MSDTNLRGKLIRLAHEHPEFRKDILPLLREAGCEKLPEGGMRDNCEAKKEEGKDKDKTARVFPPLARTDLYRDLTSLAADVAKLAALAKNGKSDAVVRITLQSGLAAVSSTALSISSEVS